MRVMLLGLLALISTSFYGQQYIVLTDSTKLLADIEANYPDSVLAAAIDGTEYAIIPKSRIAQLQLEKNGLSITTLPVLDRAYTPAPYATPGQLIDKGASSMIGGIVISVLSSAAAIAIATSTPDDLSIDNLQSRAMLGSLVGLGGGALGLGLTISGLTKISRAGKLMDAKVY